MGYFDGGFTVSDVFQNQLSETWTTQQYFIPYFRNNVLLITGYPSTTTFISDASVSGFNLNVFGDIRATKINPYLGSNYSVYFDGTGDYLQTPASSTAALIGETGLITTTSTLTIECWIYQTQRHTTAAYPVMFGDMGTSGSIFWGFGPSSTGLLTFYWYTGAQFSATGNDTIPLNTWTHIAVSISSGAIKLFVNGNLQTITGSSTTGNQSGTYGYLLLGMFNTGGAGFAYYGYISNLRIVKSALYSTSFTPSTTPLTAVTNTSLLICQSNRFIDNSTNNFTITPAGDARVDQFTPFTSNYLNYGSAYFDATGDRITTANIQSLAFGTRDFTVETWIYSADVSSSTQKGILQTSDTVGGLKTTYTTGIMLIQGVRVSAGSLVNQTGGIVATIAGTNVGSSAAVLNSNSWNHVALTRSSGVANVYVNGTLVGSAAASGSCPGTHLCIGGYYDTAYLYNGYMSDFRIVSNTAVYSGNFTPPSAPLLPLGTTSIYSNTANVNTTFAAANTVLLTLQTSRPHNNHTFFDNSPFNNLITRAGNPNQGTFSPYGTGWSNYFDGTGDYLTAPSNAAFTLGTGDFTVEAWVYATTAYASAPGNAIGGNYIAGGGGSDAYWVLYIGNTGTVSLGGRFTTLITSTGTVPLNTWTHIAIARQSGTTRAFINGVLSGTSATVIDFSATAIMYVGAVAPTAGFANWTGSISNFRVVKGTAVYIGNFTPPIAPLTAVTNTSLLTCQSGRFKDNSVNDFTLTPNGDVSVQKFSPHEPSPPFSDSTQYTTGSFVNGSTYFDGTGDYLTAPTNSVFSLAGNFTIECWLYPTAFSSYKSIWSGTNAINSTGFHIGLTSGGNIFIYSNSSFTVTSSNAMALNAWNHVAVVRNGGVVYIYINGVVSTNSWTTSTAFTNAACVIGTNPGPGSEYYFGYITDLRIIKGTAVYTGNFTPPTVPLLSFGTSTTYSNTANVNTTFSIANTSLLCNFTDAAVKDYSGISTIEHTGNVRLASNVSKYGGTALYFDGTTGTQLKVSKLAANNPVTTVVGTANLTAEMWVYPFGQANTNYSLFTFGSETTGRYITSLANGQVRTNYSGSSTVNLGGNVQPNVWSHIAIVKRGSNIAGYVNGTLLPNTETNSSSIGNGGANIGANATGSAVFFGYIDDVRITNGNVRYTANFSVPNQLTIP